MIAAKDTTERPSKEPPLQITKLPKGTQIISLTLSLNGQRLLFTTLSTAVMRMN